MSYDVIIARDARKSIAALTAEMWSRVERKVAQLSIEPRPSGCKRLRQFGATKFWRVRVGSWRIIYAIDDAEHTVRVCAVEYRSRAYRR